MAILNLQPNRTKLFAIIVMLFVSACSNDDIIIQDTPPNVFQSFWDIMDKRYVFFEEKNINWDSIYQTYYPKITASTSDEELVGYFTEIIAYINDGHVSIIKSSDCTISFFDNESSYIYYDRFLDYYKFRDVVNTDKYILAQADNSVLYFNIKSFLLGDKTINAIKSKIKEYNHSNGLILDVRGNIGGELTDGVKISALFFKGEKNLFYRKYKTGYGHNDFTDYKAIKMKGDNTIPETIPIVLLANKGSYSMANEFCFILKNLGNCTFIGEHTGGGGGSVIDHPLPKGWILTYTRTKSYSLEYELMENGLEPDIKIVPDSVFWKEEHAATGKDLQFEAGVNYLLKK